MPERAAVRHVKTPSPLWVPKYGFRRAKAGLAKEVTADPAALAVPADWEGPVVPAGALPLLLFKIRAQSHCRTFAPKSKEVARDVAAMQVTVGREVAPVQKDGAR